MGTKKSLKNYGPFMYLMFKVLGSHVINYSNNNNYYFNYETPN